MRALVSRLRARSSKEEVREAGLAAAVQMSRDLLAAGAPGLQFFTLNRSTATSEILARLRRIPPHRVSPAAASGV